ncbi:hypothetical protein ACO1O0_008468 [Amphichorda felina]
MATQSRDRNTLEDIYPCPASKRDKLQVGAEDGMGIDDVLKHAEIGRDLLNIVLNRGEDC